MHVFCCHIVVSFIKPEPNKWTILDWALSFYYGPLCWTWILWKRYATCLNRLESLCMYVGFVIPWWWSKPKPKILGQKTHLEHVCGRNKVGRLRYWDLCVFVIRVFVNSFQKINIKIKIKFSKSFTFHVYMSFILVFKFICLQSTVSSVWEQVKENLIF